MAAAPNTRSYHRTAKRPLGWSHLDGSPCLLQAEFSAVACWLSRNCSLIVASKRPLHHLDASDADALSAPGHAVVPRRCNRVQPQNPAIRPPKSPKPDVVALASRFVEPLTTEDPPAHARPAPAGPRAAASAPGFTGRPWGTNAQPDQTMAPAGPGARGTSGPPINVLISALVVIALVPSAILFVQLWQYMMRPHSVTLPVTGLRTAETARPAGLDYPKKVSARFEVADGDNTHRSPTSRRETAPPAAPEDGASRPRTSAHCR